MAVGLSCAGTGLKDAVTLLEPMLEDTTDYVRQVRHKDNWLCSNAFCANGNAI